MSDFDDGIIDLSGMTKEEATKIVLMFATDLKDIERQINQSNQDKKTWEERIDFANNKGRSDLAEQAKLKIVEIDEEIVKLESRKMELEVKVDTLKKDLSTMIDTSNDIDAEALLEQLKEMANGYDDTKKAFQEYEADEQLKKLKEELGGNKSDL